MLRLENLNAMALYIVVLLLLIQINPANSGPILCTTCALTCAGIAAGTIPATAVAILFGPAAAAVTAGVMYLGAHGCLPICLLICVTPIP
jgi:hypothetical protein